MSEHCKLMTIWQHEKQAHRMEVCWKICYDCCVWVLAVDSETLMLILMSMLTTLNEFNLTPLSNLSPLPFPPMFYLTHALSPFYLSHAVRIYAYECSDIPIYLNYVRLWHEIELENAYLKILITSVSVSLHSTNALCYDAIYSKHFELDGHYCRCYSNGKKTSLGPYKFFLCYGINDKKKLDYLIYHNKTSVHWM